MIDIAPFIQLGLQQLQPYLCGIDEFIKNKKNHPRQGSRSLREKPPDLYLRNMLSVGVLSRLSREAFLRQKRRIIVLPDCLKNYGDWTCCKVEIDGTSECSRCNSDCYVFESIERFADDNTAIVLEPDDLKDYFGRIVKQSGPVGVVGVACVLTLLSGFKTTLSLKLPTQGVFLNYSSCGHHWADPPYNTSYSFRRMAWLLGKDNGDEPYESAGQGQTYSLLRHPDSPDDFYRRLDELCDIFEKDYLPRFRQNHADGDLYDISLDILDALVPDLVSRDSA